MLSDKIKALRKEHNMTQNDLAQKLNVAQGAVAMWETDKRTPDVDMLKKIANYFNVSLDWLTGNSEYRNVNEYGGNQELSNVYFSLAKEAQEEGIDPDDIKLAFELIKANKKRD